jgi:hypothetical protein
MIPFTHGRLERVDGREVQGNLFYYFICLSRVAAKRWTGPDSTPVETNLDKYDKHHANSGQALVDRGLLGKYHHPGPDFRWDWKVIMNNQVSLRVWFANL